MEVDTVLVNPRSEWIPGKVPKLLEGGQKSVDAAWSFLNPMDLKRK